MLLHDLLGDRQPQANPQLLGREIRVEDAVEVFLADAGSGIRDDDFDGPVGLRRVPLVPRLSATRSEEHTSELQSRLHLVCRLLLEKKKNQQTLLLLHNT